MTCLSYFLIYKALYLHQELLWVLVVVDQHHVGQLVQLAHLVAVGGDQPGN